MNKSKPNTEYKIAVDSELSDEELKPRIISRKQKKERKQRIITSLSTTTTTEELAYPIQYYFNPELYLNFLNQCYLPNDNNNICKKWNDGIKKSDAIRLIPLAEELNLEKIEIEFVRRIIDSYRILQESYCENMKKYFYLFVNLVSVLKLRDDDDNIIDEPNFEPTTNIIDEKFIELLCKYKEPFKRGMKLIKQNIIDVSKNMRKMYDLYGVVYSMYEQNYNEEEEKEEIMPKLILDDDMDDKLNQIIDLKKIFPKAGFTQDGGGDKIEKVMKHLDAISKLRVPKLPISDNSYKGILGVDGSDSKTINISKISHIDNIDYNEFATKLDDNHDKFNNKYISNYQNLIMIDTLDNIIKIMIAKIDKSDIMWVTKQEAQEAQEAQKAQKTREAKPAQAKSASAKSTSTKSASAKPAQAKSTKSASAILAQADPAPEEKRDPILIDHAYNFNDNIKNIITKIDKIIISPTQFTDFKKLIEDAIKIDNKSYHTKIITLEKIKEIGDYEETNQKFAKLTHNTVFILFVIYLCKHIMTLAGDNGGVKINAENLNTQPTHKKFVNIMLIQIYKIIYQ